MTDPSAGGKATRKNLQPIPPLRLAGDPGKSLIPQDAPNSVVCKSLQDGSPGAIPGLGWPGAPPNSPNSGLNLCGAMLRIPISGLQTGNQEQDLHSEAREPAAGSAIVYAPAFMRTAPPDTVEILLHLHGLNVGSRTRKMKDEEGGMDKGAMAPGTVRDVTVDRIGQQIEASGRKMIGILPQGTYKLSEEMQKKGMSRFGPKGLAGTALIQESLNKIAAILKWPKTPATGDVVLSAHSGGGGPVVEMLKAGSAPVHGREASAPAGLKEVVLFDAINSWGQLKDVIEWVHSRLKYEVKFLQGKREKEQADYLATSMRFYARYTPNIDYARYDEKRPAHQGKRFIEEGGKKYLVDEGGKKIPEGYGIWFPRLRDAIEEWFSRPENKSALSGLAPESVETLKKNYKNVESVGHRFHTPIVGRDDALLEAIKNLPERHGAPHGG